MPDPLAPVANITTPAALANPTPAWRRVVSSLFFLLGAFFLLGVLLTPDAIREALIRFEQGGWAAVREPTEIESLARATFTPMLGVGLIFMSAAIHWCRWSLAAASVATLAIAAGWLMVLAD